MISRDLTIEAIYLYNVFLGGESVSNYIRERDTIGHGVVQMCAKREKKTQRQL